MVMSCQRSNGEEVTHIKDLKSDNLPLDKALGIHWDVERDTINFAFSEREQPENCKGVLSSVATVLDPLRFATSLLQLEREINQELCKLKLSWDNNIPEEIRLHRRKWREDLINLQEFRISRCFKPESFGRVTRAEPHHFADASQENGYGTVSYLRLILR